MAMGKGSPASSFFAAPLAVPDKSCLLPIRISEVELHAEVRRFSPVMLESPLREETDYQGSPVPVGVLLPRNPGQAT